MDSAGNLYFTSGNCVFKITSAGSLVLVAGTSRPGFSGDNGPAVNAQLNLPVGTLLGMGLANLYIADSLNNRIRIVNSQRHHQYLRLRMALSAIPSAVGDVYQA